MQTLKINVRGRSAADHHQFERRHQGLWRNKLGLSRSYFSFVAKPMAESAAGRRLYELAGKEDAQIISPYSWIVKFALAHKDLEYEREPCRLVEKEKISCSGQPLVSRARPKRPMHTVIQPCHLKLGRTPQLRQYGCPCPAGKQAHGPPIATIAL